jgi:PKD repeat protein
VNDATMNDDFEGRIVSIHDWMTDGSDDECTGHGTHVAGSVLGSGVNSGSDPASHDYAGSYAGLAPEAQLVFQAIELPIIPPDSCILFGLIPPDLNDVFQQAFNAGARIHTNSWGSAVNGQYTSHSQQTDQFAWNNKDFTILFATGNEGKDDDDNGVVESDSLMAPATAKNCITVGASESYRLTPAPNLSPGPWSQFKDRDTEETLYHTEPISSDLTADEVFGMAAFSGRGPADDGRIKPDLVAPGTWVLSVYSQANHPDDVGGDYAQYDGWGDPPNRWYKYMGGTSMATPLTAGAAALVRQYYNDVAGLATPSSALIKATLINGAYDMTPGQYGSGPYQEITARPDNVQGWGRVNLVNSLMPAVPRWWWYDDHNAGLSTNDVVTYTSSLGTPLVVMDGTEALRVSLVWTDYPGSPTSGGLVNDLDLEVTGPGGSRYYGNGVAWDRTNNVEGVDVLNPAPGTYTITVHAHNVAQDTQPYALVVSGALGDASCKALNSATLQAPALAGVNQSVPFTATVLPSTATWPLHYSWAFGDGLEDGGIVSTTAHVYETPGLYTAVVTASNCVWNGLAADELQIQVTCFELTAVDLLTDGPVELGQSVVFSAAVSPSNASPPLSYSWDFGDGMKDTGFVSTTSHLYASPGLYTTSVTATNCGGAAAFTDTALVEVTCSGLSDVRASADDPVMLGSPMHFQTTITPTQVTQPISYTWDFGAGGSGSGLNGPSPVFTYTGVGTPTVTVTATNCAGNNLVTDTLPVVITTTCLALDGVVINADDPVVVGEPMQFQATILPTGATGPVSYAWDFGAAGDGSGLDGPNPIFTYTQAGIHTVSVVASNCAGAGLAVDTQQVVVQEACQPLTGVTASGDDPVALGAPMHFHTVVTPTDATQPIDYAWDFGAAGSGSGVDGPSPVFTYTEPGTHLVAVAAANCAGVGRDFDALQVRVQAQAYNALVYLPLVLKSPS